MVTTVAGVAGNGAAGTLATAVKVEEAAGA
jgi:hypothetical protein